MTTTPLNTDAIAEALWGIAAAITASGPQAPQITPDATKTYGPTANPDAFRPALELLPIGAVAELDEPIVLDGPKAEAHCIPSGTKVTRVEKHRHGLTTGHGSGFNLYDADGSWRGNTDILLEAGISARDFSLPELEVDEVEDVVNKPSHYRQEDGLEAIDFSYDLTGPWFSVVRYVWRCLDKGNPVQDLEKALRYIQIADEKGLEKPRNTEHYHTFCNLWLRENEDRVAEARYYALMRVFDERLDVNPEAVHRAIETLLELIKEEA